MIYLVCKEITPTRSFLKILLSDILFLAPPILVLSVMKLPGVEEIVAKCENPSNSIN